MDNHSTHSGGGYSSHGFGTGTGIGYVSGPLTHSHSLSPLEVRTCNVLMNFFLDIFDLIIFSLLQPAYFPLSLSLSVSLCLFLSLSLSLSLCLFFCLSLALPLSLSLSLFLSLPLSLSLYLSFSPSIYLCLSLSLSLSLSLNPFQVHDWELGGDSPSLHTIEEAVRWATMRYSTDPRSDSLSVDLLLEDLFNGVAVCSSVWFTVHLSVYLFICFYLRNIIFLSLSLCHCPSPVQAFVAINWHNHSPPLHFHPYVCT